MASISNVWFKLSTLKLIVEALEKKKQNGIAIDIAINDEENQYNQNVSAWASQNKEQREAKTPKYYVGNGRCVWSDGNPPLVVKYREKVDQFDVATEKPKAKEDGNDGLPF